MATSVPEQVGTDTQVWSITALQINEIFDKIVWNANTRRNQLLKELEKIKSAFEAKNRSVENSITELERLARSMEEAGLRENLAVETLKESLIPIKKSIQSLQSSILNPTLEFKYSCNYDLLSEISRLGTFVGDTELSEKDPIDYKKKINSFKTFGTKGSLEGEFHPQEIHFDSESNTLFIVDSGNCCVKIFDIQGNFISQFGKNVLETPCGIATDGECYFITDVNSNSLFKFKKTDYSLVKKTSDQCKLNNPLTVKVFEREVFVVEKRSNKVSVFDLNLNFKREIGVGRFREPKTLEIYKGELYVIDQRAENNLYVFTPAGEFIRASSSGLKDPGTLCFDRDGNMIMTDYSSGSGSGSGVIKVFSPTGDLIHQIGKGVPGTEAIEYCTGLALVGDTIIVAVHSPDHCIKFF